MHFGLSVFFFWFWFHPLDFYIESERRKKEGYVFLSFFLFFFLLFCFVWNVAQVGCRDGTNDD